MRALPRRAHPRLEAEGSFSARGDAGRETDHAAGNQQRGDGAPASRRPRAVDRGHPRAGLDRGARVVVCPVLRRRDDRLDRRATRRFARPPRRPHHRAAERTIRPSHGQPHLAAFDGPRSGRDHRRLGKKPALASGVTPLAWPRTRALRLRRQGPRPDHPQFPRLPARCRPHARRDQPALHRARAAPHRRRATRGLALRRDRQALRPRTHQPRHRQRPHHR